MLKKKIAIVAGLFTILILAVTGCYKTTTIVENPGDAITTEVSFSKDVIPIFQKSCALSGCHEPGGKTPDLSSANALRSLTNGGYIKANDPENSQLVLWINGKKSPVMPLGKGPDQEIIAQIYAWIKQGANNN